ncbi:hypothetical protein BDP55DRAFT_720956 [Colletotrichum godetiae]|uniref:Uncharacterized protein n=1 Tax=Colletotrichum godetiae TaxID=1209918 RepID=A0AAJ0A7Q4_9PEZI|nr:uncharacterized protein BDP55DRAFT_720956 [Colletotrichum godetiae]KAK1658074.1 hypothetical protein BDP55DRAFT_720956 [Colletotrichum godetiae]
MIRWKLRWDWHITSQIWLPANDVNTYRHSISTASSLLYGLDRATLCRLCNADSKHSSPLLAPHDDKPYQRHGTSWRLGRASTDVSGGSTQIGANGFLSSCVEWGALKNAKYEVAAYCPSLAGRYRWSVIDLNSCLVNIQGELVAQDE